MHWDNLFRQFRHYWTVFLFGGPVGFSYAWRLARVQTRLRQTQSCIAQEKQNHRSALQGLNDEVRRLVSLQQTLTVAAAQFRRCLDGPPPSSAAVPPAWPTLNDKS